MSTPALTPREIALEGAHNVRDLGGLTTRDGREIVRGKLFRADALHKLTDADLELMKQFNIATVVDLRSASEASERGIARLVELGAKHRLISVMGGDPADLGVTTMPTSLAEVYSLMSYRYAAEFVQVLEHLADPANQPAVFHCAAGKDRTGITAALVYSILDVDREEIIRDYVLTEAAVERMIDYWISTGAYTHEQLTATGMFLHAEDETIRTFLTALDDAFGSPVAWMRESGLGDDTIASLREGMLG